MKPVLVDACNHFDFSKSTCSKCGRSLPDVCLEFEQMKQKAEAYDAAQTKDLHGEDDLLTEEDSQRLLEAIKTQQAETKKPRGRPRKVTSD